MAKRVFRPKGSWEDDAAAMNYLRRRGYDVQVSARPENLEKIKRGEDEVSQETDKIEAARRSKRRSRIYIATAALVPWAFVAVIEFVPHATHPQTPTTIKYHSNVPVSAYQPVGIGSFGLFTVPSKVRQFYPTYTSGVSGYAEIDRLEVSKDLTGNGKKLILDQHMASLQLNATAWVMHPAGKVPYQKVLWLQNVATFDTSTHTVYFSDSIASIGQYTKSEKLHSLRVGPVVSGHGSVSQNYYQYWTNPMHYTNDTNIYLFMKDTGSRFEFGYAIGNSIRPSMVSYYDEVTINPKLKAMDSYFAIYGSPNSSTPNYNPASLVFAGPYNNEIAIFNKADVPRMALYYYTTSGRYLPLPITFSGSYVTGERAFGIRSVAPKEGYARVETGKEEQKGSTSGTPPIAPLLEELNRGV